MASLSEQVSSVAFVTSAPAATVAAANMDVDTSSKTAVVVPAVKSPVNAVLQAPSAKNDCIVTAEATNTADAAASVSDKVAKNIRKDTFDFEPSSHDEFYNAISESLKKGTIMLKVSARKAQRRLVRIKPEAGQLLWESKHAGILNIENIRELRFGADARGFREQLKMASDCEPRWITLIYTSSGRYKILHLVALTTDDFKLWRQTLQLLYDQRKELMGGLDQMRKRQAVWLKQHWSSADINEDQKLDVGDVEQLCRNLNISASPQAIRTNFERADVHKRGYLDFADFQLFVKYLRRRTEMEQLMRQVAGSTDFVSKEAFQKFLKGTQKTNLPDETIEAVYTKFSEKASAPEASKGQYTMTIDGFTSFLMSSDNMALSERQLRVCDDMTRPLCEYYISSSHNTYLLGSQLKGDSTAEGYIRALQQGCRTVELDIWDGPEEPLVYHGRTLTSRLPVRDALVAIAKYAFVASPYPVILSMEVHCDHSQQEKLAEILRSTLGNALVDSPLFGETVNEHLAGAPTCEKLPSPEDLKYRILVKAKNLYVIKESTQAGELPADMSEDSGSSSATSSDSDIKKAFNSAMRIIRSGPSPSVSPPISAKQPSFNLGPPSTAHVAPGPAPTERQQSAQALQAHAHAPGLDRQPSTNHKENRRLSLNRLRSRSDTTTASVASSSSGSDKKEKPLMSLSLAALIVYTVGVKWRGLNKKEQYESSHVVSLGEKRAIKIIKDSRKELISHCRTHLVRTYPAGMRFTSSNYLPFYFWAVGVQMASLNWQTYDLGTEINSAFFQRNGRSGYVLKPDILRIKRDEEKDKEVLKKAEKYILTIEILSAQQLPRPRLHDPSTTPFTAADEVEKTIAASVPVSPFVEVTIHTPNVQREEVNKYRTSTIVGNGFNPVFDTRFQIPFTVPLDMLDLAFLRMEVLAKIGSDDLSLGKYTVSLPVLMPGYRHVPLYDYLGQQYLFSSLFIRTELDVVMS